MTIKRNKRKITTKTHYGCLNLNTNDLYQILSIIDDYFEKYELKINNTFNNDKIIKHKQDALDCLEDIKNNEFYNQKFNQMGLTAKNSNNNVFKISLNHKNSFIECYDFKSKGIVHHLEDILNEREKRFGKTRSKISKYHLNVLTIGLIIVSVAILLSLPLDPIIKLIITIFLVILEPILATSSVFLFLFEKFFYNTIHLNKLDENNYSRQLVNRIDLPKFFTLYKDDILDIVSLLDENNYEVTIGNYSFTHKDNIQKSLERIADENGKYQKEININSEIEIILNPNNDSYISFNPDQLYYTGISLEIRDIIDKRENKLFKSFELIVYSLISIIEQILIFLLIIFGISLLISTTFSIDIINIITDPLFELYNTSDIVIFEHIIDTVIYPYYNYIFDATVYLTNIFTVYFNYIRDTIVIIFTILSFSALYPIIFKPFFNKQRRIFLDSYNNRSVITKNSVNTIFVSVSSGVILLIIGSIYTLISKALIHSI